LIFHYHIILGRIILLAYWWWSWSHWIQ